MSQKKGFSGSDGIEFACNADQGLIPGSGRPTEKRMATHSSILIWRILWIEELGRLESQSVGVTKCWIQLSDFHFHSHNLGFLVKGKFSYDLRITILDTLYSNEISQ